MREVPRFFSSLALSLLLLSIVSGSAHAQASYSPPNDLPNPYRTISNWAKLPDGRKWGATSGVAIGPDGNIWTYERCGGNSCADSNVPPILEFDPSGKILKNFGAGLFVLPHGIFVDKDGNVWVTDGVGGGGTSDDVGKHGKGHQVFKFSPNGKVLMTLGKAGAPGATHDTFNRPSAVLVAPNGDIFVADGHNSPPNSQMNARIVKFSKDGKFIKEWGKPGTGPGEFNTPHALALDSKGRLFVADRANNRIQIFTQDGKFLNEWKQFGRPSGIFIASDDTMYVVDSESTDQPGYGYNPGCKRGMRIGSARTGKVAAFIPDPAPGGSTSAAEGVAVDRNGNIYGAEVGPMDLKKYMKK
ncbi:MAG TPA: peptidyl-alpha-hydroxyglycine alpha-amidating lyase family protein [Candidatus Acidoferrales bacterium]|jgi:sugar lactone lactonase YvrE|nr:peptidyl-alpha-hydroxyglycine alpha-amidating lyase family protein [Candidatus Acidoferrales bacterium]